MRPLSISISDRFEHGVPALLRRRGRAFAALAPAALALALVASAGAQNLPENAQRQIGALLSEKASRTPAQAKMDSHLVHAAQIVGRQPMSPDLPSLQGELAAVRPDARNFVEVDIRTDVNPDLLAFIRSLGGTVVNAFPEYESVRASLPLLSVERVAQRSEVRQIRVASRAYVNAAPAGAPGARLSLAARGLAVRARLAAFLAARKGAELPAPMLGSLLRSLNAAFFVGPATEGDVAHQANSVRSNFAFDGTGVKVGLLSDGVDSLASEKTAGRLPSTVNVISGQAGSGDEGTAMLEIVYTLAPGATLYFATGNGGKGQMASNIQALADAGCNMIVDDISYFDEGVFQDDVIARKVNTVTAAGAFYFVSAGNSGSLLKGTSGTWQGDFADSGTTLSGSAVHSFGATNYNTLTKSSPVPVLGGGGGTGAYELKWSDPLGQSNNDYDLFITDSSGNVLGSSTNAQTGTQDPEENITGNSSVATACGLGSCRIVVVKHTGAAARTLYLDTERGTLQFATNSATYGHAAASGAFGTSATDARYAIPLYRPACTSGFSSSCNNGVEDFSSDGPRRMFFYPDGSALTPNNLLIATNGGAVLNKPDFTAADAVTTGVAGYTTFAGTSAAAPHAAAVAALVLQAVPTLTPTLMHAALVASAIDIEGPGTDINSGSGILMAPAAVKSACGYSVGSVSPVAGSGANVSFSIQASPNCPWTITGLPSWISGATSGKGTANVTLAVAANSGASRNVTVSLVAGTLSLASASITQAGAPPLAISTSATLLSGYTTGAYSQLLTATGGTGAYTWSKTAGSFPAGLTLSGAAITGTPTAAGAFSFTLQVADTAAPPATVSKAFTMTVVSVGGGGATLARVGVLAQFAAGGGWDTEIWLMNNTAAAIPVRVVFHGDDGSQTFRNTSWTAYTLPFTVTQGSDIQSVATATLDRVIAANSAVVINTGTVAANVQGWADVLATGALSGFAIFRNVAIGEGTAPLVSLPASPTTLILPFDNTSGGANGTFSTGIALGNISGSAATVTATVWDTSGNQLASAVPVFFKAADATHKSGTWAANSHDSYLLNDAAAGIPATAGIRGVVQFQIVGGALTGVGLRVRTVGSTVTFTSVPVTAQ